MSLYGEFLDAHWSVIPILKGELKKRDEEDRKKDAELMKLRQIVDQVKRDTEEISELLKELTSIGVKSTCCSKDKIDAYYYISFSTSPKPLLDSTIPMRQAKIPN